MVKSKMNKNAIFIFVSTLKFSVSFFIFFQTGILAACMLNSDCKPTESCLKREKNAYGFCILNPEKKYELRNRIEKSKIIEIEGREEAINFFGDPEENLRPISPDGMIGKKCHSTPDCSDDQECVIAGFEGRCVQLQ